MDGVNTQSKRILVVAPQPFYSDRGTPIAVEHVIKAYTELGSKVDLLTYPIGKGYFFGRTRYLCELPIH